MKQDPPPPPGSPLPTLTTLLIGRAKRGIILDDTLAITCGGNQVNELYTFRYERTKYEGQMDNKGMKGQKIKFSMKDTDLCLM